MLWLVYILQRKWKIRARRRGKTRMIINHLKIRKTLTYEAAVRYDTLVQRAKKAVSTVLL